MVFLWFPIVFDSADGIGSFIDLLGVCFQVDDLSGKEGDREEQSYVSR